MAEHHSTVVLTSDGEAPGPASAGARTFSSRPDFDSIYREYFQFVWRGLRRLGLEHAVAEDAIQEVFIVVHRRLQSFEGRSSLRTWIYGITLWVAREHRKKFAKHERLDPLEDQFEDSKNPSPDAIVAQKEAIRLLDRLLDELDDEKREVLVFSDMEQLSAPEIAEIMKLNLNTVYSRLRAARAAFEQVVARHRAKEARRHR